MKKCNHCDREVMDDVKFCQYCGGDLPEEKVELSIENDGGVKVSIENDNQVENVAPPLPQVKSTATYDSGVDSIKPTNKGLVWLILSSILTLIGCCCFFSGGFLQIATIITSAISVNNYSKGDYEGSDRMAKVSKILFFSILGFSILLSIILFAVFTNDFFNTYEFINEFGY